MREPRGLQECETTTGRVARAEITANKPNPSHFLLFTIIARRGEKELRF